MDFRLRDFSELIIKPLYVLRKIWQKWIKTDVKVDFFLWAESKKAFYSERT